MGHVPTDNRHGLVVNVQASDANGRAERKATTDMLRDVSGSDVRIAVRADKAYDTRGFVKACREYNVTPHDARNTKRTGGSAIDGRTTRNLGYALSQRKRKCIEQCFGWGKQIGPVRQVMVRGVEKVDQFGGAAEFLDYQELVHVLIRRHEDISNGMASPERSTTTRAACFAT
ncbi:transposase [Burkholderia cepacia]|uniref:transposase n=1 Tax=Burkholderia cepacia TaxID=292 RepID=UPI003B58678B